MNATMTANQQGAHFFIAQEQRKVESACAGATPRIWRAQTIREATQAGDITIPAILRGISRSLPAVRALKHTLETRLTELVDKQLAQVKTLPREKRLEALGELKARDWQFLRGEHANILQRALREADRIAHEAKTNAVP